MAKCLFKIESFLVCFAIFLDLFRASIAESGSALNPWAFLADPKPYALELASIIKKETLPDNSTVLLEFLQSVTAKEIDIASTQTVKNVNNFPIFFALLKTKGGGY